MNIISKFRDYYDAIGYMYGSYGEGPSYIRHTIPFTDLEKINKDVSFNRNSYIVDDNTPNIDKYRFDFGVVGFCGKIYNHIRIAETKKKEGKYSTSYEIVRQYFFHSSEDFLKFIQDQNFNENDQKKLARLVRGLVPINYLENRTLEANILKFFNYQLVGRLNLEMTNDLFKEGPIFFKGYTSFQTQVKTTNPSFLFNGCVNPCLSGMHFDLVISPEQAYQELEMWFGRDSQEDSDPNSGIADKYLAAGKGYNCMSFRKRGPKSKC